MHCRISSRDSLLVMQFNTIGKHHFLSFTLLRVLPGGQLQAPLENSVTLCLTQVRPESSEAVGMSGKDVLAHTRGARQVGQEATLAYRPLVPSELMLQATVKYLRCRLFSDVKPMNTVYEI